VIIHVKLFATLIKFAPNGESAKSFPVEVTEGFSLGDLIKLLKIPNEEAKICFVNGHAEEPDYVLKENDEIGMFPPVGGGS
jgi:molybdopterin converting factor small subunit